MAIQPGTFVQTVAMQQIQLSLDNLLPKLDSLKEGIDHLKRKEVEQSPIRSRRVFQSVLESSGGRSRSCSGSARDKSRSCSKSARGRSLRPPCPQSIPTDLAQAVELPEATAWDATTGLTHAGDLPDTKTQDVAAPEHAIAWTGSETHQNPETGTKCLILTSLSHF